MRTTAYNGMEAMDLGHSAYNVWEHACKSGRNWNDIGEGDRPPWSDVAAMAISNVDLPPDEKASLEISAKGFAKALFEVYASSVGGLAYTWEGSTAQNLVAWEAVARHLSNLIDSEGPIDFADMEARIKTWIDYKLEPAQFSMS